MKRMRILLASVLMTMVVLISAPVVYADGALVSVNGGGAGTQIHVTAGVDFTLQLGIVEGSFDAGSFTINIETLAPMVYGNIGNPISGSGTSGTSGAIMISTPGEYYGYIHLSYNGVDAGTMTVTFVVSAPSGTGWVTPDTPLYTVTFDAGEGAFTPTFITALGSGWTGSNGGGLIRTATSPGYSAGSPIQLMPSRANGNVAPYYDDHTLVGWADNAGNIYTLGSFIQMPAYNIKYTAVWEEETTPSIKSFMLTVHANHSEANSSPVAFGPYEETTPVSLEDIDFKREGYTLLGYAEANDAKEATYTVDASFDLSSDMTLYAVWEQDEDDNNGGAGINVGPGSITPNGAAPAGFQGGTSPSPLIPIGIGVAALVAALLIAKRSKNNKPSMVNSTFGSITAGSPQKFETNNTKVLPNEPSKKPPNTNGTFTNKLNPKNVTANSTVASGMSLFDKPNDLNASSSNKDIPFGGVAVSGISKPTLADGITAGAIAIKGGDYEYSYNIKEGSKTIDGVSVATHPGSVGTLSENLTVMPTVVVSGMSLFDKPNDLNASSSNKDIPFGGVAVSGISNVTLADGIRINEGDNITASISQKAIHNDTLAKPVVNNEGSTLSNTSTKTIDSNSSNSTFLNRDK